MLMTIEEATTMIKKLYNELDNLCNVDTSNIEIVFSHRGTQNLGSCKIKSINGKRTPVKITIQDSLLLLETDKELIDTAKHEYAHAVNTLRHPNIKPGHGPTWQNICLEIGCRPKATAKIDKSDDYKNDLFKKSKYVLQCTTCQKRGVEHIVYKARSSKMMNRAMTNMQEDGITSIYPYYCTKCFGSVFKVLKAPFREV